MSHSNQDVPIARWWPAAGVALLVTACCILWLGAAPGETSNPARQQDQRLQRAVAEKIDGWTQRREESCYKRALEVAIPLADSLILDYARSQNLMLERPGRPIRPPEPELKRPSDTLVLAPFLRDTL